MKTNLTVLKAFCEYFVKWPTFEGHKNWCVMLKEYGFDTLKLMHLTKEGVRSGIIAFNFKQQNEESKVSKEDIDEMAENVLRSLGLR